jgi:hypothetical protein
MKAICIILICFDADRVLPLDADEFLAARSLPVSMGILL